MATDWRHRHRPQYSPDGAWIASDTASHSVTAQVIGRDGKQARDLLRGGIGPKWLTADTLVVSGHDGHLRIVSRAGDVIEDLGRRSGNEVTASDGRWAVAHTPDDIMTMSFAAPIPGGRSPVLAGEHFAYVRMTPGDDTPRYLVLDKVTVLHKPHVYDLSLSRDGFVAWRTDDTHESWIRTPGGAQRMVTVVRGRRESRPILIDASGGPLALSHDDDRLMLRPAGQRRGWQWWRHDVGSTHDPHGVLVGDDAHVCWTDDEGTLHQRAVSIKSATEDLTVLPVQSEPVPVPGPIPQPVPAPPLVGLPRITIKSYGPPVGPAPLTVSAEVVAEADAGPIEAVMLEARTPDGGLVEMASTGKVPAELRVTLNTPGEYLLGAVGIGPGGKHQTRVKRPVLAEAASVPEEPAQPAPGAPPEEPPVSPPVRPPESPGGLPPTLPAWYPALQAAPVVVAVLGRHGWSLDRLVLFLAAVAQLADVQTFVSRPATLSPMPQGPVPDQSPEPQVPDQPVVIPDPVSPPAQWTPSRAEGLAVNAAIATSREVFWPFCLSLPDDEFEAWIAEAHRLGLTHVYVMLSGEYRGRWAWFWLWDDVPRVRARLRRLLDEHLIPILWAANGESFAARALRVEATDLDRQARTVSAFRSEMPLNVLLAGPGGFDQRVVVRSTSAGRVMSRGRTETVEDVWQRGLPPLADLFENCPVAAAPEMNDIWTPQQQRDRPRRLRTLLPGSIHAVHFTRKRSHGAHQLAGHPQGPLPREWKPYRDSEGKETATFEAYWTAEEDVLDMLWYNAGYDEMEAALTGNREPLRQDLGDISVRLTGASVPFVSRPGYAGRFREALVAGEFAAEWVLSGRVPFEVTRVFGEIARTVPGIVGVGD